MVRWFRGLQFRLILGFTLALGLALASVGVYTGYAANREVEQFSERLEEARIARVGEMISLSYSQSKDWSGIQSIVERAGSLYGRRIVVTDAQGRLIADSQAGIGRLPVSWRGADNYRPIRTGSEEIGFLALAAVQAETEVAEPAISRVVSAVNWSLVWAGLAAWIGGVLLVTMLSRRILSPVRDLTGAAARLGLGNLDERVEVSSSDELGQLGRTFNTMADDLQRAEQQRVRLMSDVAHELRTPLTNVRGYLEAMRDGVLTPTPAAIDVAHQQAMHLGRLVEDLGLIAQADAGALTLDFDEASLAELATSSVEAFRPAAEGKGISLRMEAPSDLRPVRMDSTRIAQALGNLLDNAVRHTPEGGVVLVLVEAVGESVRVSVEDTGEGVPEEELGQIFDRFYRVDQSRSRATGGTGLGLTIARQLVEAHGGSIWAEGRSEGGSRFVFEVPIGGDGDGS